jgi:hypothetical protein
MKQSNQAMSGIAPPTAGEWVDARSLGMVLGVSERTLWRWRKAGLFKPGVHWRRKFPTSNSPVLYHLPRCDAAMSEAAARTPQLPEID